MGAILDSVDDGVVTFDQDREITSFNRAAEKIIGISREQAIDRPCCDIVQSSICGTSQCTFNRTLATGRPTTAKGVHIVRSSGERIPISITANLLKNSEGRIIGGVETNREMSLVEALRDCVQ